MFDRLIGNEKFKKTLGEFISCGKIPQAIIIEGEAGLGKHLAAAYVAAAALCTDQNKPCGKCNHCRNVFGKNHTDVKYYAPEKSTFTVDMARTIRSDAYLKPLTGGYNIAILEHCELMNAEAQNALLKVLEEPPSSAMFILLTENAGNFLTTVLSRCVLLRLIPVSSAEVTQYLEETTEKTYEEVYPAVMLAEGNIGKALSLLDDEDTEEIKTLAKDFSTAFYGKNGIELLKCGYKTEKFEGRAGVLKLLYETLFTELKCGVKEQSASLLAATEAVGKAIERLAANGNKAIVINNMCMELIKATKL